VYIIQQPPSDSGFELTPGITWDDQAVSTNIVNEDEWDRRQIPSQDILSKVKYRYQFCVENYSSI
jgi:hypothetical protein